MHLYWIDLFHCCSSSHSCGGCGGPERSCCCALGCTVIICFPESVGMVLEWYCPSYCFSTVQCAFPESVGTVWEWYWSLYCFGTVQCIFPESVGTVWEQYWSLYCFSHRSCRIWKTFEDVPLDVLILKLGTFSPFTKFSSG